MEPIYTLCRDSEVLLDFLYAVDNTLPVPLSQRIDMEAFAQKSAQSPVYTVTENGRIVSAALVIYGYLEQPYAYLNLLATVPGYEGRGYARTLMGAAEEDARKVGMTHFYLHTNASNARAVRFYERRGYRILETEPKLHMAKPL